MRYLQPASLTWWSGVVCIALGGMMILDNQPHIAELSHIVAALTGSMDASPAQLILTGFGLIGIRDKLERLSRV